MQALSVPVGANRAFPGFRGPIAADASFTYAPPPELDPAIEAPTYGDLDLDVPKAHRETAVHLDPEFPEYPYGQAYTFGAESTASAGALYELQAGDVVFFHAPLDYAGQRPPDESWINPFWGVYLLGHFELARDPLSRAEFVDLPAEEQAPFESNAHVHRSSFDAEVLVLGHPDRSQLYERAVPLSSPGDPSRANRIVRELSEDSADPGWRRRLLSFDESATLRLLYGIENDTVGSLLEGTASSTRTREGQAFLVLDEAPGVEGFRRFLTLEEPLFELGEWIEHHVDAKRIEPELFATLTWVATGGSRQALTGLWRASMRDLETVAAAPGRARQVLRESLGELDKAAEPPFGLERAQDPARAAGRAVETLTSFSKDVSPTVTELLVETSTTDEASEELFTVLADRVEGFGPRTAFEQLRVWHRVLGLEEAAPSRLRPRHVDGARTRRGFEAVFGRGLEQLDHEEAQACLDALVEDAESGLGWERPKAVFEVQRAMSGFQEAPAGERGQSKGHEPTGWWTRLLARARSP